MDNRKVVFIIVVLLLLLLCFYNCKKEEVLTIASNKTALPTQPQTTQRPAYLGQPIIDAFAPGEIVIPDPLPPELVSAEVIYNQGETNHAVLLYFTKPMQNPNELVPLNDFTVFVNGVGFKPTILHGSSNIISFETIISNIGDTVTISILSGNIYSSDGALFAGVTDFVVTNDW